MNSLRDHTQQPALTASPASPRCATCLYVMPSFTASTGLRCGLKYHQSTLLMRKLLRMDHYPEVKDNNACEAWRTAEKTPTGDA